MELFSMLGMDAAGVSVGTAAMITLAVSLLVMALTFSTMRDLAVKAD